MSETTSTSSQNMPFLGFTFNGHHSSDFGIIRVINGDRLKEDLTPEFQDITQEIEGADGMLYYGTRYKKRDFVVDFAFDNLTEEQLASLKKWLNGKEIKPLVFDERKNVTYSAKVTGKAIVNYIPFDGLDAEGESSTIYKGEGSVTFTCYFPFGKTAVELELTGQTCTIEVGDEPSYPVIVVESLNGVLEIKKGSANGETLLEFDGLGLGKNITIDCKKFLIYSDDNIYNDKITQGDFFSIDTETALWFSVTNKITVTYDKLYY